MPDEHTATPTDHVPGNTNTTTLSTHPTTKGAPARAPVPHRYPASRLHHPQTEHHSPRRYGDATPPPDWRLSNRDSKSGGSNHHHSPRATLDTQARTSHVPPQSFYTPGAGGHDNADVRVESTDAGTTTTLRRTIQPISRQSTPHPSCGMQKTSHPTQCQEHRHCSDGQPGNMPHHQETLQHHQI
jgi:hypothetical protein